MRRRMLSCVGPDKVEDTKPLYEGVELIGGCELSDDGILSNFYSNRYGQIPFTVDLGNDPWEVCICINCVSGAGGIGGVGSANGWTPIYSGSSNIQSYLKDVGWPLKWDYFSSSNIGVAFVLPKGTYQTVKCSFSGSRYEMSLVENGTFAVKAYADNNNVCNNGNLRTMIGGNRGNVNINATFDLKKSYIVIGDKLMWEGVRGAYRNVNGKGFTSL